MRILALFLAAAVLAPLATAQKNDHKPDEAAVVGTWAYTVVTPQQTYQATFTIAATEDGYVGEFVADGAHPMTNLEVDGATTSFEFEQPVFGQIAITGAVDAADMFKGEAAVGTDAFPITATRVMAAEIVDAMNASTADPHAEALVGTWDYTVRPDDPVAEGTFTFVWDGGALDGAIQTDAERKIETIELEADQLTFTFAQPGKGTITIKGTVTGNTFDGVAQPEGQDVLPFVASRQSSATAATD